jgi:hypothetical protein
MWNCPGCGRRDIYESIGVCPNSYCGMESWQYLVGGRIKRRFGRQLHCKGHGWTERAHLEAYGLRPDGYGYCVVISYCSACGLVRSRSTYDHEWKTFLKRAEKENDPSLRIRMCERCRTVMTVTPCWLGTRHTISALGSEGNDTVWISGGGNCYHRSPGCPAFSSGMTRGAHNAGHAGSFPRPVSKNYALGIHKVACSHCFRLW